MDIHYIEELDWSSVNVFSGVMNHASPSESGFGGCQENANCPNA
jgi:hypothetical protein